MNYKYMEVMAEYGATDLDDPDLSADWVNRVKDFLQKEPDMSDDEKKKTDQTLFDDFYKMHEKIEKPSVELQEVRTGMEDILAQAEKDRRTNLVTQGRLDISEADKLEDLEKLRVTYKDLPEIIDLIDKKIDKIRKATSPPPPAKSKEEIEKEKADAEAARQKKQQESQTAQARANLYKVIAALKPYDGKDVNYDFLRGLGLNPDGEDMVVGSKDSDIGYVRLWRQFQFFAYQVDVKFFNEKKEPAKA